MRNRRATSQNSVLFSARPFRIRDIVRPYRIQLLYVLHRTPWLPPFVLCVSQNLTSADRTDRSEDGDSQAERAIALRREIASDSTISRISEPAWEVRVSVAPDFRLHCYIGLGSLYFVSWDQRNGYAQTHQKIPQKLHHISFKNRLPQIKVLCGAFFQESDRFPFPSALHFPPFLI